MAISSDTIIATRDKAANTSATTSTTRAKGSAGAELGREALGPKPSWNS